MPFEKGKSGNPSGRSKGSPNKVTQEIREKLEAAIQGEMKDIQKTLRGIKKENPTQYLTLLEKFMGYIVPKKKDITSDGEPIQVVPISGVNIIEDGVNKPTPT